VAVGPDDIRRTRSLGGGALGDLGAYCGSAFRLLAGEPQRVSAERVLDGGADPDDLVAQAALLESLERSAETGQPVEVPAQPLP
jgi:xylose dehydrogenase (NAD/NADP)